MILLPLGFWTKLFLVITRKIEKSQLYTFLSKLAAWLDSGAQLGPFTGIYVGTNTLASYDATNLRPGARAWVPTVRGWFTLIEGGGALTPNARTIVTANSVGTPVRHWVWDGVPDPSWLQQAAWFVDSVAGNDENNGSTAGTAVKTLREIFERRIGHGSELATAVVVTVAANYVAGTDALDVELFVRQAGPGPTLAIQGTETVLYSGSFTAGTADLNRATPSMTVVADAAMVDFAPYVGKAIEITSGANAGAFAWIVKRTAATTANTSAFAVVSDQYGTTTRVAPASGDSFKIVSFPALNLGRASFSCAGGTGVGTTARINRLNLIGTYAETIAGGEGGLTLLRSRIEKAALRDSTVLGAALIADGCCYNGGASGYGRQTLMNSCAITARFVASPGDPQFVTQKDTLFFAAQFAVNSGVVLLGYTGFFDCATTGAISAAAGSTIRFYAELAYGTGNTGFGIIIQTGAQGIYATKPEINKTLGAGRETSIGGTDKQYGAIPYVEATKQAMLVVA